MRQQFSPDAVALGHSFKQACANNGLDVQVAAPRFVAEQFLKHWHAGMGPSRFMIKGGLKFPQSMRPTTDADIVSVRRFSNLEIQRGFRVIAKLLETEGITVTRWSAEAHEIETDSDPVSRYRIYAHCGTVRADFDLDISTARGPDAYPATVPFQTLPRLFKSEKWPVLRAQVQPDEASCAEKWLAVLMQDRGDYRVKHLADVLSFDAMQLDVNLVSAEIQRVCRHRGIPMSVCAPSPAALEWRHMSHREASWDKLRAERGFAMTFDQAFIDINGYWAETHQALTRASSYSRDTDREITGSVDNIVAFNRSNSSVNHTIKM